MASVKRLDTGRWRARFRDNEGLEHAAHRRTRAEAQAWLDEQTASLVRGDWRDPRSGRLPIAEQAERWYGAQAQCKPSTLASYRALLDKWVLPRWGRTAVRDVEHSAVAAWAAEMGALTGPSTARKALGVLRGVLELSVRDRRISANPALGVKTPPPHGRAGRFLSAGDLEALAAAAPTDRDRILVQVLGWTGLRFGEAIALRVERIDLLRRRLRIVESISEVRGALILGTPKNHQARTVALPAFLVDELAAHLATVDRDGLAFPNRDGGPLRNSAWRRRAFASAATSASLVPPALRVHDLRHTAASLMIASGANVKAVQHQLGHGSATLTLDLYGHLFPDELEGLSTALDEHRTARLADYLRTAGGAQVSAIGPTAR